MNQITNEEKIDYIYRRLKRQEKTEQFSFAAKWIFRILIFGYLYYFITVGLPEMIRNMIPEIPSFSNPVDTSTLNMGEIQNLLGDYFGE